MAAKQVIAAANLVFESSYSKHRTTMAPLAASVSCQEQQMQRRRQHHHSHHIMDHPSVTSSNAAAASIITPPPSPQLLLEGDEMYISSDGKSHTYYRLHHAHHHSASIEYLLEEAYDIENARKEITLLQQPSFSNDDNCNDTEMTMSTPSKRTPAQLHLSKIFSFPLQEINNGIQKGAGTGSTTWDSSIAMGLYFGMYPQELLVGKDVLELGSGVGLGGILARVVSKRCKKNSSMSNGGEVDRVRFTLSEVNRDIINMLRYNTTVAAAANASSGLLESDELHIEQMDWFDFLVGGTNVADHHSSTTAATNTARKKYDTIIASDCIYLPSQIKPLSETIAKLLASDNPNNQKAHIFSPYNRGFIQDLIHELREGKNMDVHVETIEMSKFRVKFTESENVNMSRLNWLLGENETTYKRQDVVSSCTAKFLHITASFKNDGVKESDSSDESMTSID